LIDVIPNHDAQPISSSRSVYANCSPHKKPKKLHGEAMACSTAESPYLGIQIRSGASAAGHLANVDLKLLLHLLQAICIFIRA